VARAHRAVHAALVSPRAGSVIRLVLVEQLHRVVGDALLEHQPVDDCVRSERVDPSGSSLRRDVSKCVRKSFPHNDREQVLGGRTPHFRFTDARLQLATVSQYQPISLSARQDDLFPANVRQPCHQLLPVLSHR